MKKKITVYLSSTKYHWWNLISKKWKKDIQNEFKKFKFRRVNFIDPLMFDSNDPIVCEMDIKDINISDYVIVYLDKITIGTLMELCYCIHNNKKFYVITFNKNIYTHPWIVGRCKNKVFTNYSDCVKQIHNDYINNKNGFKHEKKRNKRKRNRTI